MDSAGKTNYEFQKIIAAVGVILMAIKFVAFYMTGSIAILTDALESIVNVVAGFLGLYALYLSAMPPDRNHPFGHGKVENISAGMEGAMILMAGGLIIYESVQSFLHPGEIRELDIGLVIIAAAALVNYLVGRAAIRKGIKGRSPALVASGKHLCSDTYSSVGIILGLLVVYVAIYMGYDAAWLDSSIAIVFGVIISFTGIQVVKKSFDDSMDKADYDLLGQVTEILNEFRHDDWIDIYRLRLIKYGPNVYVDMHVVLCKDLTVKETYTEECQLEEALQSKFKDNVELSITPVPCVAANCRWCDRNCFDRKEEFEKHLNWTTEMLMSTYMHDPPRTLVIDDSINPED